jgi:hypothetical protein
MARSDDDEGERESVQRVNVELNKPFRLYLSSRLFLSRMSGKHSNILAKIGEFSPLNWRFWTKLVPILIYPLRCHLPKARPWTSQKVITLMDSLFTPPAGTAFVSASHAKS